MITLHLKIVYRGESKTQFVSNVFDVVVRWYSRFRDTFAIRRAGSCQHNEGAFELREVRSKTDRGRITVPDEICLRISICPTTQWREARYNFFFLQEASKAEKNQSREISWQPMVYARDFTSYCFTRIGQRGIWYVEWLSHFFWDEICLPSNKWSKSERGMFLPSNKSPAHFMMSPTLRSGRKIRYSNTTKYTRAQK